jgi:pimeloyl-ACP methyl ester carboxylesterase
MLRIAALLALALAGATAIGQPLARRADTGTAIAPPGGGKPATIVRFRPGSALEKAGLRVGDAIVAIDGQAFADGDEFGARIRKLREGNRVRFTVRRAEGDVELPVSLPAMRKEAIPGVEVRYGEARSARGYRVRTYTSRPANASGRLPVVVFIPWLSCGPVENPLDIDDGWSKMLRDVMREGGAQVVRIEKPGLGDSEGPDCADSDLEEDLAAFRAGIRAALEDPGGDPQRLILFGGSVGGALAPSLAAEFPVRGIVVTGGFTQTWLEHMLDIERRRLALAGQSPAEVNAAMRAFGGFYDRVLNRGETPAQAIAAQPQWKAFWYDAPTRQYGRPMRYYQQLQALDVEGAWARVTVPTLVVWGEYDWIMGRAESDRAVQILRARDPALVTYEIRRGMNHHFDVFADAGSAFKEQGGTYDAGAARVIATWLLSRARP